MFEADYEISFIILSVRSVFHKKNQSTFITLTPFDYQIVQAYLTEMEIYHLIFNAGLLAYHIIQNTD